MSAETTGAGTPRLDDHRFDLTTAPWILVTEESGERVAVSLRELFDRAPQLRQVVGDVPTQAFAIERLLVAIALRATQHRFDYNDRAASADAWIEIWNDHALLQADVAGYLDAWASRFDLLDRERPFYQVASLQSTSGAVSELAKIIPDVPNGERYFTTRSGRALERISQAEAARWVVHAQAMDVSGIKTGAVGDSRVAGGRGYPIGPGWAASIGGVALAGASLAETILLNLVPVGRANAQPPAPHDAPAWERDEPLTAAVRDAGTAPVPRGPLDLLTWQSRRILLAVSGRDVVGVTLSNGDPLVGAAGLPFEKMTAQNHTAATRKLAQPIFTPTKHQPDRLLWRGLTGLIPRLAASSDAGRIAPASFEWLDELTLDGVLPAGIDLRVRAYGLKLDSKNSVIEEMLTDEITTPTALLGEKGGALAAAAEDMIVITDRAIRSLGDFARSVGAVHSANGSTLRGQVVQEAYHAVDDDFRVWLASLRPDTDPEEARLTWLRGLRSRLTRDADSLLARDPSGAWLPRESSVGRTRGKKVTAFQCRGSLDMEFRKLFPAPSGGAPVGEAHPADEVEAASSTPSPSDSHALTAGTHS